MSPPKTPKPAHKIGTKQVTKLPGLGTIYRRVREDGSRIYVSTEQPGDVEVWDTRDVTLATLVSVIAEDIKYVHGRSYRRKRVLERRSKRVRCHELPE